MAQATGSAGERTGIIGRAGPAIRRRFDIRTFDSLKDRDYAWFFLAMLGHMAALNMQMLVRGWLVFDLTGSYARLGIVGLATALPMLTLSVFGGVIADRAPKKRILQAGQFASMLNAIAIAVLVLTGMIAFWHLVAASLVQGTIMALMMPSRQALIPDVVGRERLMNAVSLNAAGMNLMRLLAPALGGFLIVAIGAEFVYFIMAGLYLFAVLTLFRVGVRHADTEMEERRAANRASGIGEIMEGIRYIARTPTMLALLGLSFITSMLAMPYLQLLPGFVDDVFNRDADSLGLMISVSGAGALVGALVIASLPQRHRGLLLMGSAVIIGIGLFFFSVAPGYEIALIFMVIVGVGSAGRQALSQVLLQEYVDDEYRGRVMSVYMTQFSMMQMGTFIVGTIAGIIGARAAFGGLALALIAVTVLAALLVPRLRRIA